MMHYKLILIPMIGISGIANSQSDIGVSYENFYALYKSKDDGTGFRNTPKSQYSGLNGNGTVVIAEPCI